MDSQGIGQAMDGMFKTMDGMFKTIGCIFLILLPFAICGGWKLIEIFCWLWTHVEIKGG